MSVNTFGKIFCQAAYLFSAGGNTNRFGHKKSRRLRSTHKRRESRYYVFTLVVLLAVKLAFPSVEECCSYTEYACQHQGKPKCKIAVIPGLRACCILATSWCCSIRFITFSWLCLLRGCFLNLKICTAFTVCLDNSYFMSASRKCLEIIGF